MRVFMGMPCLLDNILGMTMSKLVPMLLPAFHALFF